MLFRYVERVCSDPVVLDRFEAVVSERKINNGHENPYLYAFRVR